MQVYYMHEEGINAGASSVTLLFWTIIYKVVLVVFELYVFLFHFDFAVKYIGGYMWLFIIGMAVNVVSIVLYTIIVFSETGAKKLAYMGTWLLHKLKIVRHKEKAEKKLDALLDSYKEGAVLYAYPCKGCNNRILNDLCSEDFVLCSNMVCL